MVPQMMAEIELYFALHSQPATAQLDDSTNKCKSQPGTFASLVPSDLCLDVRREQLGVSHVLRFDTYASITNLDSYDDLIERNSNRYRCGAILLDYWCPVLCYNP